MLYDAAGTALASFSVSNGTGNMPKITAFSGVAQQNGQNYFVITTSDKKATTIMISDSDKAVMKKKGFAGVCLNGTFKNW